mmetsp:Transcript_5409/g.11790  ORF Transcript_5409/g.11790 Transcript_5409/m.11790 type:complete len:263 (+) Transcript_5409:189-977(+)
MVLQGRLLVRLFEFGVRRVLRHAEQLVEIFAETLLQLQLRLAQCLRDGGVVGLDRLRLFVVGDGLLEHLELQLGRAATKQGLDVAVADGESRVAVIDAALEVRGLELGGGPVRVERQVKIVVVRVELDRRRVRLDRLVVSSGLESFVALRLGRLDLFELEAHLARSRVVWVKPKRLRKMLQRLINLPRAVERLAAHADQIRIVLVLAHPPRRFRENEAGALLRSRAKHRLHLQASDRDRSWAPRRERREEVHRLLGGVLPFV